MFLDLQFKIPSARQIIDKTFALSQVSAKRKTTFKYLRLRISDRKKSSILTNQTIFTNFEVSSQRFCRLFMFTTYTSFQYICSKDIWFSFSVRIVFRSFNSMCVDLLDKWNIDCGLNMFLMKLMQHLQN